MSVLGWIGFGLGLLVVSFICTVLTGKFEPKDDSDDVTSNMGLILLLIIPILSLIGGIYAKIAISDSVWLILILIGGFSFLFGVIVFRLTCINVKKMKEKGDIGGLIKALDSHSQQIRRNAAKALIVLYRSGNLTEQQKQKILSARDTITQHTDRAGTSHSDRYVSSSEHIDRRTRPTFQKFLG